MLAPGRCSFAVTIQPSRDAVWPVTVVTTTAGELPIHVTGVFAPQLAELRAEGSPRAYGERLGRALFVAAVRDEFIRAQARGAGPLHVLLTLDAEDLRELHWEYLCGPLDAGDGFLALDQRVAYSRFLASAVGRQFRPLERDRLRALVVVAAPDNLGDYGLPAFDAPAALAAVTTALGVPCDVLADLPLARGLSTLDALCDALTRDDYAILHFVAHGRFFPQRGQSVLFLADAAGRVAPCTQSELADRLRVLADLPQLAFFAACESAAEGLGSSTGSLARHLVAEVGMPAVVAMSGRVSIATAHAFTRAFYGCLLRHGHVDEALVEATAGLQDRPDVFVPVLYGRLGARPLFASRRADPAIDRNRDRMLGKVRLGWIDGVLQRSLGVDGEMRPPLAVLSDATAHPWDAGRADLGAPQTRPPGTSIVDLFDEMRGELLILGGPGAGKTTQLLLLARSLLARAEHDHALPIPVVFNLSSWATHPRRTPLTDWLVAELNRQYDVPRQTAGAWIAGDHVLPLLDGLDETPRDEHAACIAAINEFRREHGFVGLVVCSRDAAYCAANLRLKLSGAVLIQPLAVPQIDAYLARVGGESRSWSQRIADDPGLHALAPTPLTVALVLASGRAPDAATGLSADERRRELVAALIDRLWTRGLTRHPRERVLRWLARLAHTTRETGQRVFLVEHMQPRQWLSAARRRRHGAAVGVMVGCSMAVAYGLGAVRLYAPLPEYGGTGGALLGALYGLVFGVTTGVVFARVVRGRAFPLSRGPRVLRFVPTAVTIGLLVGATVTVLVLLMKGADEHFVIGRMFTGLVSGLLAAGLTGLLREPEEILIVDKVEWSWRNMFTGVRRHWAMPIVGAIALAAACGIPTWAIDATSAWLAITLLAGLGGGLSTLVIIALHAGLAAGTVSQRSRPNEGIRRSAWYALLAGTVTAVLLGGLTSAVVHGFERFAPGEPLRAELMFALGLAVPIALIYGGLACIQHVALRLVLWRDDAAPLRYVRFLDDCCECGLLGKVGGGYMFFHSVLLEHLADLHVGERPAMQVPAVPPTTPS